MDDALKNHACPRNRFLGPVDLYWRTSPGRGELVNSALEFGCDLSRIANVESFSEYSPCCMRGWALFVHGPNILKLVFESRVCWCRSEARRWEIREIYQVGAGGLASQFSTSMIPAADHSIYTFPHNKAS